MITLKESTHLLDVSLHALHLQPLYGLRGTILAGTLASPHVWDTGDGIGAWTGTAEGMKQHASQHHGYYSIHRLTFGVTIVILKVMDAVWPA